MQVDVAKKASDTAPQKASAIMLHLIGRQRQAGLWRGPQLVDLNKLSKLLMIYM